jgi:hypothetical protein
MAQEDQNSYEAFHGECNQEEPTVMNWMYVYI